MKKQLSGLINKFKSNSKWQKLNFALVVVVVYLISFPGIEPVLTKGLDSSYFWALNNLFAENISAFNNIVFTFGPLGFLKSPLPYANNLLWFIFVISLFKLFFIGLFLFIGRISNKKHFAAHVLLVFILSFIIEIDFLITAVTALALMIHYSKQQAIWYVLAVFSATVGLYIKSSIGIISFSVFYSYLLIDTSLNKNLIKNFIVALSGVVVIFVAGIAITGAIGSTTGYLEGIFMFIASDLSASAIYVDNNWWLLSTAFIVFVGIPFIIKKKEIWILYAMFLFSFFAVWKHSMTREDIYHARAMLFYLILFGAFQVVIIKKVLFKHVLMLVLLVNLYYANLRNTASYRQLSVRIGGINNFTKSVLTYDKFKLTAAEKSKQNIYMLKLDDSLRNVIDDLGIDVYPWNLNYIAANKFNWTIRPTLQELPYNTYLDQLNAQHFNSRKKPDFVIWHTTTDYRGIELAATDDRYILHSEPKTAVAILNNYKIVHKQKEFVLMQKTTKNFSETNTKKAINTEWGKWIDVPYYDDGILRAKLYSSTNAIGKIKSVLYKEAACYIEYILSDSSRQKFRIVRNTAPNGLWINPFLLNFSDSLQPPLAKKIRFITKEPQFMHNDIRIEWITNAVRTSETHSNKYNQTLNLFGKTAQSSSSIIFYSKNSFENEQSYWSYIQEKITEKNTYEGRKAVLVKAGEYSPTFRMQLDSTHKLKNRAVAASLQASFDIPNNANLIIAIDYNDKNYMWEAETFANSYNSQQWNYIQLKRKINKDIPAGAWLGIYVWNNGENNVIIDNFEVRITE